MDETTAVAMWTQVKTNGDKCLCFVVLRKLPAAQSVPHMFVGLITVSMLDGSTGLYHPGSLCRPRSGH